MSEENKAAKPGPKAAKYKSIHKGKFFILKTEIVDGFKLSPEQKANKKFMKIFDHAEKIGLIVKG